MQRNSTATLAEIIAAVQRRWGTRALRLLRDAEEAPAVLSTGFAELDRALAIGGVPRGRLTELLGTPTSGMTTIALTLIARAQARAIWLAISISARHSTPSMPRSWAWI